MTQTTAAERAQKPFGFSALRRLKKPQEFQLLRQRGQRFRAAHLVLNTIPNTQGASRLGVSVSKKHVRSAVRRNMIKRLVREYFRLHRHELPSTDVSVALLARVTAPTPLVRTELQGELTRAWKKAAASLVK
jgi:ribonuclease P protein component